MLVVNVDEPEVNVPTKILPDVPVAIEIIAS